MTRISKFKDNKIQKLNNKGAIVKITRIVLQIEKIERVTWEK